MQRLFHVVLLFIITVAFDLRLNDAQWKASHNSYFVQRTWEPNPIRQVTQCSLRHQFEYEGVRGFEFDIVFIGDKNHPSSRAFNVMHDVLNTNSNCGTLGMCIDTLIGISNDYPNHFPISVMIDVHDALPGVSDWINTRLLDVLDEFIGAKVGTKLWKPADFIGNLTYDHILDVIQAKGWPTIDSLRNKIFFQLDNSPLIDEFFKHGVLKAKDRNVWAMTSIDSNLAARTECPFVDDPNVYSATLSGLAQQGYITICRCDVGDRSEVDLTRKSYHLALADCNLIQTDFPAPPDRRADPNTTYWITLEPHGSPVACFGNATASKNCTSYHLEHLGLSEIGKACTHEYIGKAVEVAIIVGVLLVSTFLYILAYLAFFTTKFDLLCCSHTERSRPFSWLWLFICLIGNYMYWIGTWLLYEDSLQPETLRLAGTRSPDPGILGSWLMEFSVWLISFAYGFVIHDSFYGLALAWLYWAYGTVFCIVRGFQMITGLWVLRDVKGGVAFLILHTIIGIILVCYLLWVFESKKAKGVEKATTDTADIATTEPGHTGAGPIGTPILEKEITQSANSQTDTSEQPVLIVRVSEFYRSASWTANNLQGEEMSEVFNAHTVTVESVVPTSGRSYAWT